MKSELLQYYDLLPKLFSSFYFWKGRTRMPQYNSRVCHPTELANVGPLDEQGGSHPWTPVNYKEMGSRSLVIDQNDIAKLTVDDQKNAWVEFLGFFFFFACSHAKRHCFIDCRFIASNPSSPRKWCPQALTIM